MAVSEYLEQKMKDFSDEKKLKFLKEWDKRKESRIQDLNYNFSYPGDATIIYDSFFDNLKESLGY